MIIKNKFLFYCSIILNLFLVSFFSIWLIRSGKLESIISNFTVKKVNQKEEKKDESRPKKSLIYYGKIDQFKILDLSSQSQNRIVFLGDSLTEQGEWQELLNNNTIKNRGIGGDTTDDILARIDPIIQSKPEKIFLMVGVNDLWLLRISKEEIIDNYKKILQNFKQNTPQTKIYIQSLLPIINSEYFNSKIGNENILWLNEELKKLAQEFNYEYIDLYPHFINEKQELNHSYTEDGIHLNGKGYLLWRDLVKNYI